MAVPTMQQTYQTGNLSPNGTTVLVGTSSITAIGPNPQRRGLIFFNPGTVNLFICPANQTAVIGQGVPIYPGAQQTFFSDGNLIFYNSGFNIIAASGSSNPCSIWELL